MEVMSACTHSSLLFPHVLAEFQEPQGPGRGWIHKADSAWIAT